MRASKYLQSSFSTVQYSVQRLALRLSRALALRCGFGVSPEAVLDGGMGVGDIYRVVI